MFSLSVIIVLVQRSNLLVFLINGSLHLNLGSNIQRLLILFILLSYITWQGLMEV